MPKAEGRASVPTSNHISTDTQLTRTTWKVSQSVGARRRRVAADCTVLYCLPHSFSGQCGDRGFVVHVGSKDPPPAENNAAALFSQRVYKYVHTVLRFVIALCMGRNLINGYIISLRWEIVELVHFSTGRPFLGPKIQCQAELLFDLSWPAGLALVAA